MKPQQIDSLAIIEYDEDENLYAFVSEFKPVKSGYYQSTSDNTNCIAKYDMVDKRMHIIDLEIDRNQIISYSEYLYKYQQKEDLLKELYSHTTKKFIYTNLINPYREMMDQMIYDKPMIRKCLW